jgi:hypothetical protein
MIGKAEEPMLEAYCRALADAGIQNFIVSLHRVHEMTPIEIMQKEILPAVAEF